MKSVKEGKLLCNKFFTEMDAFMKINTVKQNNIEIAIIKSNELLITEISFGLNSNNRF